jgi:hypothetical protein
MSNNLTFGEQVLLPESELMFSAIINEDWINWVVSQWKKNPPDSDFILIFEAEEFEE